MKNIIENRTYTDLDIKVKTDVNLPKEHWVDMIKEAKEEFELDGATSVYSTWRVEKGDIDGNLVEFDATMSDERASKLLQKLLTENYLLKIKFYVKKKDIGLLKINLTL